MDGFHIEGMAQDKGDVLCSAEIGQPIPGEHAFDRYDKTLPVGSNGLEEGFRSGWHIAVQQELTIVAQDADVHGPGMQVDATVKSVLIGVKSHEVFSSFVSDFSQAQHTIGGYVEEEASIIIKGLHLTASSLRSSLAAASGSRGSLALARHREERE